MKQDENVEVWFTIPVNQKMMIRESKIKDWDDEDEIKEYISENLTLDDAGDKGDIEITSIG